MIDFNKYSKSELSMMQSQIKYELQRRRREEHTEFDEIVHKFHSTFNELQRVAGKFGIQYKSDYAPCANGGVIFLTNWDDFIFEMEEDEI